MKPLRLLLVEDSENDALLLVEHLRAGGYAPEFKNLAEKLLHDIRIFTEQSAEKK